MSNVRPDPEVQNNMYNHYKQLQEKFDTQIINVYKITEFDSDFLLLAIDWLTQLGNDLKTNHNIDNENLLPTRTIKLLTTVLEQGPSRAKYQPVYNQSIVLLVSYFASTLSSIFNNTLTFYLSNIDKLPKNLAKEEFKLNLFELSELNYDLSTEIGRIIARKSDISFQDMGSISKAFKQFFNIKIQWDKNVSNIIVSQACRHAIVHNGEEVDHKCIAQINHAKDRQLKLNLQENEKITFNKDEIKMVGESMKKYVSNLCSSLLKTLSNEN